MMLKAVGAMGVATVLSPGMVTDSMFLPAANGMVKGRVKLATRPLALLIFKTLSFLFC